MLKEPTTFAIPEEALESPKAFQELMEVVRDATGLQMRPFYMTQTEIIHAALGYTSQVRNLWIVATRIESPYLVAQTLVVPPWQLVGNFQGKEHRVYPIAEDTTVVEVDGKVTRVNTFRLPRRFR